MSDLEAVPVDWRKLLHSMANQHVAMQEKWNEDDLMCVHMLLRYCDSVIPLSDVPANTGKVRHEVPENGKV